MDYWEFEVVLPGMDFIETLTTRRSVRKFSHQAVPEDLIKKIINLAIQAPSACNLQEWRFIIIKNNDIKQRIFDLGGSLSITKAPVVILILYSNQTTNLEYSDYIQSASAAIQNLLLSAHYYNLAGCWICHLPSRKALRKLLDIPKTFDPIAAVLLGYPEVFPQEVPRKYHLEQIISYDKFNFPQTEEVNKDSYLRWRRILIYIYKHCPLFIKKKFLNRFLDKYLIKKFNNDAK